MPYQFTAAQQANFAAAAQGHWLPFTNALTTQSFPVTHQGVNYTIYRPAGESAVHFAAKKARLEEAITRLQQAGLMFVNADVHRFQVVCYTAGLSRGVVCLEAGAALPTVVLMLGRRICQHVTTQFLPPPPTAGGISGSGGRNLSDRFYDYYRRTQHSEEAKCGLAQVLHEFGHVFHQLLRPNDYFLDAAVALKAAHPLTTEEARVRDMLLPGTQAQGLAHVSQYAGTDAASIVEYVAEVFAGLMMGIQWNAVDPTFGVYNTYLNLGGPVIPNPVAPISRLNDFIGQQCHCPGHGQGIVTDAAKINW
ncbi:hypothetical protein [Actinoplanes sp. RD1]|uniref:hypothetical protein n=1 Tax=Actinoplanes sp. RD1 TaxID=3064538 RepID=UPI002741DE42|nr:hypothetical protein [Actinoplanes sp. RD1]